MDSLLVTQISGGCLVALLRHGDIKEALLVFLGGHHAKLNGAWQQCGKSWNCHEELGDLMVAFPRCWSKG